MIYLSPHWPQRLSLAVHSVRSLRFYFETIFGLLSLRQRAGLEYRGSVVPDDGFKELCSCRSSVCFTVKNVNDILIVAPLTSGFWASSGWILQQPLLW